MEHKVLVTGSSGFIGQHMCAALRSAGYFVRGTVRAKVDGTAQMSEHERVEIGEIADVTDWSHLIHDVRFIVHLAGRAHVMRETAADPFEQYMQVNVVGTEFMAQQASSQIGVKRIVLVSSAKVNGETTSHSGAGRGEAFSESDPPAPVDPYAYSKWEAEKALRRISLRTKLEYVIVRPPLVYGPGVGANFLKLIKWVASGRVLPFGSIRNLRSLLYVENLTDAIVRCLEATAVTNKTYMISDIDVSTPDLIRGLAAALRVTPRLINVPPPLLRLAGIMSGQSAAVSRLLESLVVDSRAIRHDLDWIPPWKFTEGLAKTASWFLARQ